MDVQVRAFMKHCMNILISMLVITTCYLCNQAVRIKWWIGKTYDFLLMLFETKERKEEDYDSEAVERGNKFVDHLLRIIFQNREASESYRVEDRVVTIDQKITFINIHGKFGLCSTNLRFGDVFQRSGKCSLREEEDKIRVNAVIGGGSLLLKTNACIEFLLLTKIFPMNGILPYIETYIEFEFDKETHKNGKILELFIDEIRGMHLKFEDEGVLKMILNIILSNSIKVFQSLLKNVFQSQLKAELDMLIKNFEFPAEIVAERQPPSIQSKEQITLSTQEDSVSEEQSMEQCAPEEYQTEEKNGDSQVQDFSLQAQQSQASESIDNSPLVKHLEASQALDRFSNVEGSEILKDSEVSLRSKEQITSSTQEDSVSEEQSMEQCTLEEYQTVEKNGDSQVQDFSLQAQQSQASESIDNSPLVKHLEASQALDRFSNVEGSEILKDSEVSLLIKHFKESQTSESILAPQTPENLLMKECEAPQCPEGFSLSKQQEAFHSHESSLVKKRVAFQPLSDSSEYGSPLEECEQSQFFDVSAFVEESEDNEKLSIPETPCLVQHFSDKKEFLPLAESPLTDKNEDSDLDLVLEDSPPKNENI